MWFTEKLLKESNSPSLANQLRENIHLNKFTFASNQWTMSK
jgi:hypothetical protein